MVYGIFVIVNAQNVMTHTLIQTTDSLALDAYLNTHVNSVTEANEPGTPLGRSSLSDMVVDAGRTFSNEYFASSASVTSEIAKKRFMVISMEEIGTRQWKS